MLIEVIFPPSMSICQAKQFIFRELEELPVQASSQCLSWVEETSRLVFRLAEPAPVESVPVPLGMGIREMVAGHLPGTNGCQSPEGLWVTSQIEFDRGSGWDRLRAEEWIRGHLGLRDLGRTTCLDAPHRMDPGLATFLSDLLFDGAYRIHHPVPPVDAQAKAKDQAGSCSFVPCLLTLDALAAMAVPRWFSSSRFRPRPVMWNHGGVKKRKARTDRAWSILPSSFRQRRGGPGIGSFRLAAPRPLARRIPRRSSRGGVCQLPGSAGSGSGTGDFGRRFVLLRRGSQARSRQKDLFPIAVLALYPAQAELIRRLVRSSPRLTDSGLQVGIDVPGAYRERECLVAFLSLTRSHGHRAVSFGEGPQMLALGLTRARSKLVLFGDPGTLARRCQWEGPLDHLDEDAAARERDLIDHLVRYLEGQGPHQEAFHLCEGGGQ